LYKVLSIVQSAANQQRDSSYGCSITKWPRHDTTLRFAALHIATSRVIGRCYPRYRAIEFGKFPAQVEQAAQSL